ncbi:MAG TPA: type II secretion system F family protein [Candidatus Atribacteria bacterium]|nr:type II secretion system F family protein [Candidatus Atribacteria bacterium]HPT77836.1 type II secretion system F family protein [Candidatus Atribacteria bacterium]
MVIIPKYQYKAVNMSGRVIEGVYEAINKDAVVDMIRQKNFFQLEIKELPSQKDINDLSFLSKIGSKDISLFCKQFAAILRAGVPLVQGLNMLSQQTENKKLKSILSNIYEVVQKGNSLSDAMRLHEKKLPAMLINMIEAGEVSGTLDETLETMAVHYEKDYKMKAKVKGAMTYPIVVLVIAIAVVILMLTAVVPMFIGLFENSGAPLPGPTKLLIGMSEGLKANGLVYLLFIVIAGILIKIYLSTENGKAVFHRLLLQAPLVGKLQVKVFTARLARTLGTLMRTGVDITKSINLASRTISNVIVQKGLFEVEAQVNQGKSLYEPIKALKIFPVMLENMVMLGEESGTLEDMLIKTADFYEEEVDREIQKLTSLMEPAIIVVLGGMIAFIVLSIMLPMFEMMKYVA